MYVFSLSYASFEKKKGGWSSSFECVWPLESVWPRAGIGNVVMVGSSSLSGRVEMGVVL